MNAAKVLGEQPAMSGVPVVFITYMCKWLQHLGITYT